MDEQLAFFDSNNFFDGEETVERFAPKSFMLMKYGKCPYTKDGEQDAFEFNEADADNLIQEFENRGKDLVIDYDHSTMNPAVNSRGDAPAAGWIERLEKTPEGLKVYIKNWTPKAKQLLQNGEYRYYSPVCGFKDTRPKYLHSVALTNHPALHGLTALVAANDTAMADSGGACPPSGCIQKKPNGKWGVISNKTGEWWNADYDTREDAEDALKAYHVKHNAMSDFDATMEIAKSIKESINAANKELVQLLSDIESYTDGDEEKKKQLTAFADELFDVKVLADMTSIISQKQKEMDGDKMLAWIDEMMNTVISEDEKQQLQIEKDRLTKLKEDYPDLWAKGFTVVDQRILNLVKPPEESISMNDISSLVGLTDKEVLSDKIASIVKIKDSSEKFLKLHDCKDFDDVTKKILTAEAATKKAEKEYKDKIVLSDATLAVELEMNKPDCKITENTKQWAVEYYIKNGKEAFNDFIKSAPVAFSSTSKKGDFVKSHNNTKTREEKELIAFKDNDAVKQCAKAFGVSIDEAIEVLKKDNINPN